ncbi:MAG: 5'/3'-nucleotidase SurE [Bauldia sp.]|uniref:5'/3'-nucleotidase SurE n=1 Tax=Bauldia sp. TaxID=2575872 RepID=UPI001D9A70A5|nr:5'/3'-nucleotidase SurE [Bauldia sp.]MCB1495337.1 5'/3'-nucleotidase SurE [Bauldia sp.]
MRILLTNDDGIHAPGLAALERIAAALSDDVWVVAPETDQSGLSHSLSLNDPLRLREINAKKFALRGTPTDCVIMAMRRLLAENRPDLILSGVNSGQNAADDVTYSGTVAGAMEGTLLGIPSIALSQASSFQHGERQMHWDTAEKHAPDIIRKLMDFGFPPAVLYNLNFPNRTADAVDGVMVTTQGRLTHGLHIDERTDGRGNQYFWLAYRRERPEIAPGTDLDALSRGAVSVTPLRLDMTAYDLGDPLSKHMSRDA